MFSDMIYNTGESSEELKALYNPEGSVLRKAQLRMLEMLIFLDGVFKELEIPYRLDGGNVLGAIRHGGFVPWDDDIDVVVYPGGLEKLRCYFETHDNLPYVLQNNKTDKGYFYHNWDVLRDLKSEYVVDSAVHKIRKYKGLQIDIFTYEAGHNKFLNALGGHLYDYWFRCFLGKSRCMCQVGYDILDKIVYPLFSFFDRFIGDKNTYTHAYGPYFPYRFPKEIMFPHEDLVFEGKVFPGPAKPEEFLKSLYGDYMKLPNKDCRSHHKAHYIIWD